MARLVDLDCIDMVLSQDFCLYKDPARGHIEPLSEDYADDLAELRAACLTKRDDGPEFTVHLDGLRFRVTEFFNEDREPIWMLSRTSAQVLAVDDLPLPKNLIDYLMQPDLVGLVLVSGGMGTGKTSNAVSLFKHRIEQLGGIGLSFEDPGAEIIMSGAHGKGRIIQVPVSRLRGGYHEPLQLARRSRAAFVMIGEIRDSETATEVQSIANADLLVISTLHAPTLEKALEQFQSYIRGANATESEANNRMAGTLAVVIHLTREHVETRDGHKVRYIPRCLVLNTPAVTAKVREGNFASLNDDILAQAAQRTLSPGSESRPWSLKN